LFDQSNLSLTAHNIIGGHITSFPDKERPLEGLMINGISRIIRWLLLIAVQHEQSASQFSQHPHLF